MAKLHKGDATVGIIVIGGAAWGVISLFIRLPRFLAETLRTQLAFTVVVMGMTLLMLLAQIALGVGILRSRKWAFLTSALVFFGFFAFDLWAYTRFHRGPAYWAYDSVQAAIIVYCLVRLAFGFRAPDSPLPPSEPAFQSKSQPVSPN